MLRPQEIFILVALANHGDAGWTYDGLASELDMAPSQVFKSLERAEQAALFYKAKRRVIRRNLIEFLIHGAKYAFSVKPGRLMRGIPAGWQVPGLRELMTEPTDSLVWPSATGTVRGQSIEPLHESLPDVASRNPELHAQFALVDIIRVGSARERDVAARELERRLE